MRGEDEKRGWQRKSLLADGDLFFLHRFEQRALDLGGRAVDFIGEDEIRKHRAVLHAEACFTRVVDFSAYDIGGAACRA